MKRRSFIKNAGFAAAGAIAAPYLLPSGRLFAATGVRKANHVVFCLFAGGVRNMESVQMADGNLMPNMLNGSAPISADIAPGMSALPSPIASPLQNSASLFKYFKYNEGPTGHYNGHTVAMTGQYTTTDLNIKDHPKVPTIFEYYRKHNAPQQSAKNCWWVANTLGPYPALNYSSYADYGANFGANFIAPTSLISPQGFNALGNPHNFSSNEQATIHNIRNFANNNFQHSYSNGEAGIANTESDASDLQNFISQLYANMNPNPWSIPGTMSNDMLNIYYAEKIIQQFKPELLVVNMQDVDICHFEFTKYADNIRKSDYAVAHLWNTIQSTAGMMNDTVLIIAPEHGRNLNGNTHVDAYGRNAIDHTASIDGTGDQMARDIFCMVLGPTGVVKQNMVFGTSTNPVGESIEIVPAIANILGFDNALPSGLLKEPQYNDLLINAFY